VRSRRSAVEPFSLFAFQDVMMGTIGILLIVMLLLSLELNQSIQAMSALGGEGDDRTPAVTSADLEREVQRLEAALAELQERTQDQAARRAIDPRGDLARLTARLQMNYSVIAEINADLLEMASAAESIVAREHESDSATARIALLSQRVSQLRAALEAETSSQRLVYIVGDGVRQRPMLVELSGRRFRIGGTDDADLVFELDDPDPQRRIEQLVEWARADSPTEVYWVLLIKPSAIPYADEIERRLRGERFQVGIELLPEGFSALPDIAEPSSEGPSP